MEETDAKDKANAIIMRVERRAQRRTELSSSEVMNILRKRAAKAAAKKETGGGADRES